MLFSPNTITTRKNRHPLRTAGYRKSVSRKANPGYLQRRRNWIRGTFEGLLKMLNLTLTIKPKWLARSAASPTAHFGRQALVGRLRGEFSASPWPTLWGTLGNLTARLKPYGNLDLEEVGPDERGYILQVADALEPWTFREDAPAVCCRICGELTFGVALDASQALLIVTPCVSRSRNEHDVDVWLVSRPSLDDVMPDSPAPGWVFWTPGAAGATSDLLAWCWEQQDYLETSRTRRHEGMTTADPRHDGLPLALNVSAVKD
jgi:hypothetical protein